MQVRKFEAKTIKEAIEMVKQELGPEAIILSAKENVRGFGLMGESSVEVTAAISEQKLKEKKLAERKLNAKHREVFSKVSARKQKEFIRESVMLETSASQGGLETVSPRPPVSKRKGITQARYIDIGDEDTDFIEDTPHSDNIAAERIKSAVQNAFSASQEFKPTAYEKMPETLGMPSSIGFTEARQIALLKSEVSHLRSLLEKFQNVPQNFISMHPGAEEGIPFELSFAFKKLRDAGMATEHVVEILKVANEVLPNEQKKKRAFVDGWVIKYLLDHIQISEKPLNARYHVFFGPTGQGKTSTVVKMASYLVLQEKKKVAILTGDVIKVGAREQLKVYSQILNVPFGVLNSSQDWAYYMKQLEHVDVVLVDTPGSNLRGANELDILRALLPMNGMGQKTMTHYVQSALARDADAFEIADRFKILGFNDVIFTRLDEAVQPGFIYNFQKRYGVPLHSFGTGSRLPEDFEFATKERVIDMIFNLSKTRPSIQENNAVNGLSK